MTIFAKPIVNTKLNLKRNKYNEGRGSIPLPFIFLLRSPYTDDDYDAWVVWGLVVPSEVATMSTVPTACLRTTIGSLETIMYYM